MGEFSNTVMLVISLLLVLTSAFFSGTEIGMMSLNRYRLRHQVKKQAPAAIRVEKLLRRQERLLGVILIGNTIANLSASSVVTIVAADLYGDLGVPIAMTLFTLVVLIFAEIVPKTLAALYPEKFAYRVSLPMVIILKVLTPLVVAANLASNGFLRLFGVKVSGHTEQRLSGEELKTVVDESAATIPRTHKKMLVNIIDLEQITVDDIMVPRNEIIGVDLSEPWENTMQQFRKSHHTRLVVYDENLDNVKGFLHARVVSQLFAENNFNLESLIATTEEPTYVLEGTSITQQLINFRRSKNRCALVVDEYGDIQGLVVMEDILEEIVGEFTTDIADLNRDIHPQADGSTIIDGSAMVREVNRDLNWDLPTDGPKTINGLIVETLEYIPPTGTCLLINNYPIEIIQVKDNRIKTAKILPKIATITVTDEENNHV